MYVSGNMIPVKTTPGMRGRGHEGEWWRERIQV
jgi:hypothetical protein